MNKNEHRVSVIITTKNEESNIALLCDSIVSQHYQNWELIVVDNYSTDKTIVIAQKYTHKVYTKGPERSAQRNFGASKAIGDYLLFVDSDMHLDPSVLDDCHKKFTKHPDLGAIIIPEKSFGTGFWAKCRALENRTYEGDNSIEAARFFKKSVFLEAGGFTENMISGEDWDLTNKVRKKHKIGRISSYIHHNEGHLTYLGSIKKKYYYAKNADAYISNNVSSFKSILVFLIRPAYFRNWRILVKDPIHTLGFLFLKYSEFFVAGFGTIIYKKSLLKNLFSRKS